MSRTEELAARFETACTAFADYVAGLSPEQWEAPAANHPEIRIGEDERRPVGVVAHHVGDSLPMIAEIVRRRAAGEPATPLSPEDIDAINDRHAAANEHPDQAETAAMIRDNCVLAAAVVRGLGDEDLERHGPDEAPAVQVIERVLIGHIGWHEASIKAAVEGS
jgi:DinB superfamily